MTAGEPGSDAMADHPGTERSTGATSLTPGRRLLWHAEDPRTVEEALGTSGSGLCATEAAARLSHHGPNRLRERQPPSPVALFFRQFRNPLIYIMVIALGVVLVLREFLDAVVVAVALLLNASVAAWQERAAERTVRALMGLVVPRARVVRSGKTREIDSAEVVPGDVVVLEPGSRVPADVRLTWTNALHLDESLLTGESLAVAKDPRPVAPDAALGDRRSMAYAGSVVTSGRGIGVAVATGDRTELGAIAELVEGEPSPRTPMQRGLEGFAKTIGVAVLGVSAVAFATGILRGNSVQEMFHVAVALAVANVPEGLPVATTVALAIGVARMARRRAIIRHLPAVETLGSTTVIGSDKTGTLTENRLTVREIWAGGERFRVTGHPPDAELLTEDDLSVVDVSRALHTTLLAGVLSSEADAVRRDGELTTVGDPTEVALLLAAMSAGLEPTDARAAHTPLGEIPFEPSRRYSASLRSRHGRRAVYVKGAPERIAAMCTRMLTAEGVERFDAEAVAAAGADLAARGLRVLAFAYRPLEAGPTGLQLDEELHDLVFCGLQAMTDSPRVGVRDSISACREAGIRVVMITGDHPSTAAGIARELGIDRSGGPVLTGAQLRRMDDAELRGAVRETSVYARVAPEQKLRIVTALQELGEVLAVTGDGVNDAPALKAAQVGVAMGRDGTDVAREAADVVLADDNFSSIVAAVEQGRVTFDNIRKVTFFLVSTAIGTAIAILVGLWLNWPLLMVPAQIVWMNLVTSGLQDMALAFEPGGHNVLRRRPRPRHEGLMTALLWERSLLSGVVMAAGTLWMFHRELSATGSLQHAQTVALTTMVVFQAFQAGNARSTSRSLFSISPVANRFLFAATAAAVGLHVTALYLPATQHLLRVAPIGLQTWFTIVLVASSLLVVVEAHKAVRRRWTERSPSGGDDRDT